MSYKIGCRRFMCKSIFQFLISGFIWCETRYFVQNCLHFLINCIFHTGLLYNFNLIFRHCLCQHFGSLLTFVLLFQDLLYSQFLFRDLFKFIKLPLFSYSILLNTLRRVRHVSPFKSRDLRTRTFLLSRFQILHWRM